MQANHGSLAYAVLTGEHQKDTLRSIKRVTKSGIWSIEKGEKYESLHTNLIVPFFDDEIAKCDVFIERIKGSPRSVAAYISKKEGMPEKSVYSGRLLGAWGNCIDHVLKSESIGHEVARAAAASMFLVNQIDGKLPQKKTENKKRAESREEYREIAYRHLEELRAAVRN